mmetsp:Transcript_2033/g.2387  ORF Transcript_2033/g.2387 Transcript_2033/m.2387 type:complete len:396 (+) Transcript_2033:68-1255(+)
MSAATTIATPLPPVPVTRGRDAAMASLTMAAEANMFVKLYVEDGCGKGENIPMKDLLAKNGTASYDALRRCALRALFKHEEIPEYAYETFRTCFTCSTGSGKQKNFMMNSHDLTNVLEEASTIGLMNDNDNIVVDIYCTFVNTYKFHQGEILLESATAAAGNAKKAVKTWLDKATNLFERFVTDDDFVIVRKKESKDNVDAVEWASRFVHFLFTERPTHSKKPRVHKKVPPKVQKESPLETAEDMLDLAIVGFTVTTHLLSEAFLRHEEAFRSFFKLRRKNMKACQTSSHSNDSITSSKASLSNVPSPVNDDENFNLDRGVEIEFDPENVNNELTDDEWKIFFTNSVKEEPVLLDIPSEDDVISISSDEFVECEPNSSSSDDDSDNDSWAMLDDE